MKLFLVFVAAVFTFSSYAEAKGKRDLPTRAPSSIRGYKCTGTEPFFSVDIVGNNVTFSAPDTRTKTYRTTGPQDAHGISSGNVVSYRSRDGKAAVALLSSSIAAKCSDGMSDKEYAYHMTLIRDSSTNYGCCEPLAQD